MKFSVYQRGTPFWAVLAVSSAACFSVTPVSAQTTEQSLPSITVSGSRFTSSPELAPIGATVITSDQIRETGVGNANEAIRKIGGVYGRASTTGSQDYDLDLRGFGSTSSQNMVVLVDGIRFSENEQSAILLSSIPIESIERIEIIRGGSSVLYGEGATGGTIQIITKRDNAEKAKGTVLAAVGSFDHRELRSSVVKGWDGFSLDANVGFLRSDNYRENNDIQQNNFSGGMQWGSSAGRIGVRIDVARQDSRFAGPLTIAQFKDDPKQATTPDDYGSYDTDRYTLFAERRIGNMDIAAELSHREKNAKAHLVYFGVPFDKDADSRTTQFSPRVRHTYSSTDWGNELVVGLDFTSWNRSTKSISPGFIAREKVSQNANAFYIRDEVHIGKARIAAGARHEKFDKEAREANVYDKTDSLNAWELQASYSPLNNLNMFVKSGKSYRVANADENTLTPTFNSPLEPQTSRDFEFGGSVTNAAHKLTARVFQSRLKDEIFFDRTFGMFGANINLDPTKREGIEIEGSMRLNSAFEVTAVLQHVNAKFSAGPNDGKRVPLVPRNTATVRLNWQGGHGQSGDLGLKWVDSQWFGNDIANSCDMQIPSFTTLDGRYAIKVGAWEFAFTGSNLTDRDAFTNGYTNPVAGCRTAIYSEPGRQLKISARMDF